MNAQNRIVTYAMAIATLVTDETLSDKMRERKFSAVQRAIALADSYAKDGIREDLVDTIMEKKTALILDAKTVADVEKAAQPPSLTMPGQNGSRVRFLFRRKKWCCGLKPLCVGRLLGLGISGIAIYLRRFSAPVRKA